MQNVWTFTAKSPDRALPEVMGSNWHFMSFETTTESSTERHRAAIQEVDARYLP
jgi:hypothetical protein